MTWRYGARISGVALVVLMGTGPLSVSILASATHPSMPLSNEDCCGGGHPGGMCPIKGHQQSSGTDETPSICPCDPAPAFLASDPGLLAFQLIAVADRPSVLTASRRPRPLDGPPSRILRPPESKTLPAR